MRRVLSVQPVALQLLACRSTTLSAGPVAAFTICSSLTLQPGYSVQTVDLAGNQINMALPPLVVMSPTKKLPHSPVKQLGVPASLKAAVHPAMHAKSSIAALQPAQHCSRASLCASTVTPDRSLSAAHQQLPSSLFNSLGLHQQHQSQLQQQQQQPHHRVPQGLGFSRGHEASLHGSHPAGCRSVSCGSIATAERSAVGTGSNIQQHLQHFDILDYHRDLQPVAEAANLDAASDKPRSAMTGQRVPKQYDTPLGTDWLKCVPEHTPQIGDGRLELIVGPMFAGKSTHLLKRVQEVSHSRNRVAVAVKSSTDQRYGSNWVVTHDGKCMRCYAAETLTEFKHQLGPDYNKIQVLAIDEAQFFPDLLEFCADAVDTDGKQVIVSGLSGDFRRRKFGQLLELLPLADSITQLRSRCAFCQSDALFSLRLVDDGSQALVGGEEKYRATCRRCYLQHNGGHMR